MVQLDRLGSWASWASTLAGWTLTFPVLGILALSCAPEETYGPCGDVTYFGKCEDGTLWWCEDDELHRQDCEGEGMTCGPDGTKSGFFCQKPCGNVTPAGRCEGNTLQWCNAGGLNEVPCAEHAGGGTSAVCAWDTDNCVARCMGCGDWTPEGSCEGDEVKYCDDGTTRSIDCSAYGKNCGIDPDSGFALCFPIDAPESCDPSDFGTYCSDKNERIYCGNDGVVGSYDCRTLGLTCGVDPSTGQARCQGCNQVDWWTEGCLWGVSHVCRNGFVYWENCQEVCDAPR